MIWNQKYPAPNPNSRNLLVALLFGAFISFFLIFFEPFGIGRSTERHIFYLLFFGVISAVVLVVFLFFLPLLLAPIFSDQHWTIKHQILFCSLILFTIATCNGLWINYFNAYDFSWNNYWWIINRTFVLGGIPFAFLILFDYRNKDRYNKAIALHLLDGKTEAKTRPDLRAWPISTDLKNETIAFKDDNFTHAIAAGNYLDLYFVEEGQLKAKTLRLTLVSFEKQLNAAHLKRCHRSYLVNLKKVTEVSGNAQGLKLAFAEHPEKVPVSRKYIPLVRAFFSD